MKRSLNIPIFWLVMLMLFATIPLFSTAQTDDAMLQQLMVDEQEELEAISMYPQEIRLAILEIAANPEVLVRIQALQKETSEQFKTLLQNQEQDQQEEIWELTRYPGLLEEIVDGGKKNKSTLREIAANYPEGIREYAIFHGNRNYTTLAHIYELNNAADAAMQGLLRDYPSTITSAAYALTQQPEILGILSDNLNMTIVLGDLYNRDPERVLALTDSLALEAARKNAQELEDWKQSLAEDPEALQELEEAARNYAEDNGYAQEDYSRRVDQRVVEVHHHYHPYPYWYGYPWWYNYPTYDRYYMSYGSSWWYGYPTWYPRPYWYHWGFYYGPGGNMVIWGLPSYHFSSWYFNYPQHHYHWSHFTNHCVQFQHQHRTSVSSFNRTVTRWTRETEDKMGPQFFKEDRNRVNRIQELGHLESSVQEYQADHPTRPVTTQTYLKENRKQYPAIVKDEVKPDYQPPVLNNPTVRPPVRPTTMPTQRPKVETVRPNSYQNVNQGKDYHQDVWRDKQVNPRPVVRPPKPGTTPSVSPNINKSRQPRTTTPTRNTNKRR